MILEAIILGIFVFAGLFAAAKVQASYHVKPRLSLFSVNVAGRTEESEQMSIQFPVFVDESRDEVNAKLQAAFKIREDRLKFQNERILELTKANLEAAKKEEAEKKAGLSVVKTEQK